MSLNPLRWEKFTIVSPSLTKLLGWFRVNIPLRYVSKVGPRRITVSRVRSRPPCTVVPGVHDGRKGEGHVLVARSRHERGERRKREKNRSSGESERQVGVGKPGIKEPRISSGNGFTSQI